MSAHGDGEPPELLQFAFSHYNEKVRWALDHKGLAHVRRSLVPGLHLRPVRRLTGQTAVPVLLVDGRALCDSTAIIAALEERHPERPLYPTDPEERARALALEEELDETLGPKLRLWAYHHVLPDTATLAKLFGTDQPAPMRPAIRAAAPLLGAMVRRAYRITAERAAQAERVIEASLDRIEAERDGREHLVGSAFTVADLTAAALLSPLIDPPELPYPLPRPLPPACEELRARLGPHPAYRWALETYRRHRPPSRALGGR